MLYVIDCDNARFYTCTKKEFKDKFDFPPHAHHSFDEIWECAAELGIYAFPSKQEAVMWCLDHIPFYMDLDSDRSKNLVTVLSKLLAKTFNFQVLEAK